MQESRLLGFFVYISILGGVLHITAPGSTEDAIPKKNWLMLLLAILSGGLVAGFVIGWKWGRRSPGCPDINPLIDASKSCRLLTGPPALIV